MAGHRLNPSGGRGPVYAATAPPGGTNEVKMRHDCWRQCRIDWRIILSPMLQKRQNSLILGRKLTTKLYACMRPLFGKVTTIKTLKDEKLNFSFQKVTFTKLFMISGLNTKNFQSYTHRSCLPPPCGTNHSSVPGRATLYNVVPRAPVAH